MALYQLQHPLVHDVVMTSARCPMCHKMLPDAGVNGASPFCSERCRLIDLGRWLSGTYSIPIKDEDEPVQAPSAPEDP